MRIGGLASGMDTDSMVKQLMAAESMKLDRVQADKQILEWRKESLNSLNKDFANFILDGKKFLDYNNSGRPGNMDWIKKTTSDNEAIGTATAGKGAFSGKHTVEVVELAQGVSGASAETVDESDWNAKSIGAFKFKINDKEVSVSAGDSLEAIAKKINASGSGVQASFDNKLGRFFLRTESEGTDAKINFTTDTDTANITGLSGFLGTIKVELSNDGGTTKSQIVAGTEIKGKDGSVKYNGVTTNITSNQFTYNGVSFNAKAVGTFNVTVNNNEDDIVEKVKTFVNNYNKMLENTSKLLSEKQNRNFKPLTAEQKEAMSEKEVELWEAKAKAGVIRGDMDIERMLSNMRSDLYKDVEGASGVFKNIMDIGITTQKYKAGSVGGQLEIDEKKLRDAIARDADGVMEILFNEDPKNAIADDDRLAEEDRKNGTTTLKDKRANSGLFTRIFDNLTLGMKSIIAKSGPGEDGDLFRKVKSTIMGDFVTKGGRYSGKGSVSDIDDDMTKFNKKIDDLKTYLARKESMYYAQFTAMEKAIQKSNSQSGWLMQQMQ